jgi:hypothetical protein
MEKELELEVETWVKSCVGRACYLERFGWFFSMHKMHNQHYLLASKGKTSSSLLDEFDNSWSHHTTWGGGE